jgi:SPP1 family predicted phage head-tail adaptor
MIRAGDLRHRASLQRQDTTRDSFGQEITTWTEISPIWCLISPVTGKEIYLSGQVKSETTHQIKCRYRSEFANPKTATSLRILFKDRIFNITSCINRDERNVEVWLMASEGLNEG